MTQYRVKCQNSQCGHVGMSDGVPAGGTFVKKHFADINRQKTAKQGTDELLMFRCQKCKCRWRMRTSQVVRF